MQRKIETLTAAFLLSLGSFGLQAQEVISGSGGNASGDGGTMSYTVGQIAYSWQYGATGSVAPGVQQPYEISVLGVNENKAISLVCSAYPNPTIDYLILKVENYGHESLAYQLYDVSGKLLESKAVTGSETIISMERLMPSIYLLKVILTQQAAFQTVKTFKIIKH